MEIQTKSKKPFLVTLTAPTCGGKTFLMSHIREKAKLPCIVSTTTRPQRKGEVDGIDYYFISHEKSLALEESDSFAELANFGSYRYGVTKEEFKNKLSKGLAFLIIEPTGIDHYVKTALEAGAIWLKFFVDVPLDVRLERFKERYFKDLEKGETAYEVSRVAHNYFNRMVCLLRDELSWKDLVQWDRVLSGIAPPEENLRIILTDIATASRGLKLIEDWSGADLKQGK